MRSGDIRNNEIRTKDLRNNEVRGIDIRNSTIQGRDIALDTVTGEDIRESTLSEVPTAARTSGPHAPARWTPAADRATIVAQGGAPVTLASHGPLTVTGACPADSGGPRAQVRVQSTEAGSSADGEDGRRRDLVRARRRPLVPRCIRPTRRSQSSSDRRSTARPSGRPQRRAVARRRRSPTGAGGVVPVPGPRRGERRPAPARPRRPPAGSSAGRAAGRRRTRPRRRAGGPGAGRSRVISSLAERPSEASTASRSSSTKPSLSSRKGTPRKMISGRRHRAAVLLGDGGHDDEDAVGREHAAVAQGHVLDVPHLHAVHEDHARPARARRSAAPRPSSSSGRPFSPRKIDFGVDPHGLGQLAVQAQALVVAVHRASRSAAW